jgi:hypothetical protein
MLSDTSQNPFELPRICNSWCPVRTLFPSLYSLQIEGGRRPSWAGRAPHSSQPRRLVRMSSSPPKVFCPDADTLQPVHQRQHEMYASAVEHRQAERTPFWMDAYGSWPRADCDRGEGLPPWHTLFSSTLAFKCVKVASQYNTATLKTKAERHISIQCCNTVLLMNHDSFNSSHLHTTVTDAFTYDTMRISSTLSYIAC